MTEFVTAGEGSEDVLVPASHEAVDHTAGPLSLLDATAHDAVDHTSLSVPLMSTADHSTLDHGAIPATNVGEDNPGQVSPAERTLGTEGTLRSFSPFDVSTMAGVHGVTVKGRANSGAVSGAQPVVRLINGTGVTISLVESGGELRFTISSSGSAPGGIDQVAGTAFPGSPTPAITSLTINPGFVPRLGFCVTSWVWPGTSSASAMGVWAGKTTDQANITMSQGNIWGISTGQLATNALNTPLITATPWTCTSWLSTNVTIGGSSIAWTCGMFVVGGA